MTQLDLLSPRKSQTQLIYEHLQTGKSLTPLEALRLFGCFRLGARIWELKEQGIKIDTSFKKVGTNKSVAEYKLVK